MAIVESWVVSELYKALAHQGEQPILHHYRETRGLEMDVLIQRGDCLHAVEVKSAATAAPDFFKGFEQIAGRIQKAALSLRLDNVVVYGGETSHQRSTARLLGWRDVGQDFASGVIAATGQTHFYLRILRKKVNL